MSSKYFKIFFLMIVTVFAFVGCVGGDEAKSESREPTAEPNNPSEDPILSPLSILPEHTQAPTATFTPSPTPKPTVFITVGDGAFIKDTVTIQVGTTVIWSNEDGETAHTVTSEDGIFASEPLRVGEFFNFTFNEPGIYPYYCTFHSSSLMEGVIIVIEE